MQFLARTGTHELFSNVSIEGNGLCTSVYYKPTDSHSYLLYSSSHPSHVKNSIPFCKFLRLRRLCSDDFDFFHKSDSMCQFFKKRGYPASVVQAGHHCTQLIDRQSSLQMSQKEHSIYSSMYSSSLPPSFLVSKMVFFILLLRH